MGIYESKRWIDDLDLVVESLPFLSVFEGKSVLITGAAGLICSSVVDILMRYNDVHNGHISILGAGRWPEEMENRFGERVCREDFTFVMYDAAKPDNAFDSSCEYIIHGASNAFPSMIVKEPVETMLSNFTGVYYLLKYAQECNATRVMYISSSEVYGTKDDAEPYREGEYGYIDLLNPRNSYSVGKRAAETLCASFAAEYGVETVIVRPGHIYGPTASPKDNRVSSAWAYDAARGTDIVMKSDGSQLRSYSYCLDCAAAMLTVLIKGDNGAAYNISNPNSVVTIRQMAELLAHAGGVDLLSEPASDEDKRCFNPMSNSSLDSSGLESIGWHGLFDAPTGFNHTVEILREASLAV